MPKNKPEKLDRRNEELLNLVGHGSSSAQGEGEFASPPRQRERERKRKEKPEKMSLSNMLAVASYSRPFSFIRVCSCRFRHDSQVAGHWGFVDGSSA